MTLAALAALIGKTAYLADGFGLRFRVTIKDAKTAYGKNRYLVTPVAGDGERWVEGHNLNVEE